MKVSILILLVGPAAATTASLSDGLSTQQDLYRRFADPLVRFQKRGDRSSSPSRPSSSRALLDTQKTIKYAHTRAAEKAQRPPNEIRLKMKAYENSAIREMPNNPLPGQARPPEPAWKKTITWDRGPISHGPQLVDQKSTHELRGQMVNGQQEDFGHPREAKSSGKITGPYVRADVGTNGKGEATVTIKDPSKNFYPSGRHTETISGETSKIYRAQSRHPREPAKIKVQMNEASAAQLHGVQHHSKESLEVTYGRNRHRLPPDPHAGASRLPALREDQWNPDVSDPIY